MFAQAQSTFETQVQLTIAGCWAIHFRLMVAGLLGWAAGCNFAYDPLPACRWAAASQPSRASFAAVLYWIFKEEPGLSLRELAGTIFATANNQCLVS